MTSELSKSSAGSSNSGKAKSKILHQGDGWEKYGGYMSAKKQKLDDQFMGIQTSSEEQTSNIFKGVVIHVNGYTKPSSDELKRLMRLHGGHYAHYLSKRKVTHIIATSMANSKIAKDLKHCKVVKPEWITESVKAGRLLSFVPYLLYTAQTRIQQGLASFSTYSLTRQTTVTQIPTPETSPVNDLNDFPSDSEEDVMDKMEEEEYSDEDFDQNTRFLGKQTVLGHQLGDTHSPNKENSLNHNDSLHLSKVTDASSEIMKSTANVSTVNVDNVSYPVEKQSILKSTKSSLSKSPFKMDIMSKPASKADNTPSRNSKSPAKAGDPQYLSEFYNNSRLHHLSTWKSEWKSYVTKLQNQGSDFPGRKILLKKIRQRFLDISDRCMDFGVSAKKAQGKPARVIMHIDMDCFFVSVGLRKRPNLMGKPVAVTHSRGQGMRNPTTEYFEYERKQWEKRRQQGGKKGKKRNDLQDINITISDENEGKGILEDLPEICESNSGPETFHSMAEIASCSYEARQAGVKNGMFMGQAKKLCPEIKTIPYDFEGYQEVSKILYDTVASFTHDIEAVSCDELLVDCTDLLADTGAEPLEFATILRQDIYQKTKCCASAGMGPNILLAKMATRKAKPNGQFYLDSDNALVFIADQSVQNIPGVGYSMSRKLKSLDVTTCGQLQRVPLATLQKEFGPKTGQSLYTYCRGQDDRPIKTDQERKSVSAEINYGIRFQDEAEAEKFLYELSEEVHNRLKNIGMKGKSVTLKLMIRREDAPKETAKFLGHGICNNISKSATLPIATDDPRLIYKECSNIMRGVKTCAADLRGIGIQIQRLEPVDVGLQGGKKGGQSILNFTVPKSASASKGCDITTVVQNNSAQSSTTKSPTENNRHWTDSLRDFDSHFKCTGDLSHPKEPSSNNKQQKSSVISTNSNTNCLGKKDPGEEESPEFLEGAVCHHLLDEISRRKTAKRFLPPLPSLDMTSPPISDKDINVNMAAPESSPSVPVDYFPSPSQIDPEVLEELPQDIKQQIESEINNRKNKQQPSGDSHVNNSQKPGCSHWSDPKPVVANDEQIDNTQSKGRPVRSASQIARKNFIEYSSEEIVALPSPSQLDESCLNALPEEMQREILEAYNQQNTSTLQLKQAKSPARRGKSPKKYKSPGKEKKNSPHFKIPRGRPGRGRPRKLDFQRKQPKIDSTLYGKKVPQCTVNNFAFHESEETADTVSGTGDNMNTGRSLGTGEQAGVTDSATCDNTQNQTDIQHVNLCGAISISEVRSLLSEWLESSPVPEIEDEKVMITYLQELIMDHNLEQVDLVIKFLHRKVKQFNSRNWLMSFGRIVKEVQSTMQTFYGSTLKMCTL